jgi:3-dehydroquinate synthase
VKTLTVELGARSYPIHIGRDLLGRADLYTPHLAGRQVLVVSNETVAPLYLDRVLGALEGHARDTVVLPDGEQFKTVQTFNRVLDAAMQHRLARDATLIALGGGVVGDIAGFAAACYQRGVCYVQVPTTLLAQVDSSVGGKTAVNHPRGKNMIGAFHQPACVIADTGVLDTLPERELAAGLAEVVKYGLIQDPDFFAWIERNANALRGRDPQALAHAVERSCRNKAVLVSEDERESASRALLNFGHTFGHAIEATLGFGTWLHGEAVAAGMCMAADLSQRLGWLDAGSLQRIRDLLARLGLPIAAPRSVPGARMLEAMGMDKKVRAGRMRLILLRGIGDAVVSDSFDTAALDATLERCREAG